MTQPASKAIVYGLDWFGAASPSGPGYYADAGSFHIVTVPPVTVRPTDLEIKSASTVGVTVAPVFLVSLGEVGKLTVNFKTRVAGSFPVTLTFRGQPLNPPQGNHWMLYSHDASMCLTEYTPRFPPPAFSSWSLSDIKVGVQGNMLSFLKIDSGLEPQSNRKQWVGAGWDLPSLDIGQGLALVYRVRWNDINTGLKMNIPSLAMISNDESLVLRHDSSGFDWAIYDDRTKLSAHQSSSKIIANGMWHDIFVNISASFLRVYEDGRNVLATARSCAVSGAFDVVWESQGERGGVDADLMDFRSCPVAAHHDLPELVSKSTDLIFNLASSAANTKYFFVRSFNDSIAVTYADQGIYFCASNQLTQMGCCVSSNYIFPLRPYCVVQYRFAVTGNGCEAKITIAGNLILNITRSSRRWQWYFGSGFTELSESTKLQWPGFVSVLVVVSPGLLTLFEDGEFHFEFILDPPSPAVNTWATFNVQIENPSRGFGVQLSHLRILSGLD